MDYFGWVGMGGALFLVCGGGWDIILGGWGVGEGEWECVHCLIMPF